MASMAGSSSQADIDPALHRYTRVDTAVPIDPALFELEGLVNDVRQGKVKLGDHHEEEHEGGDEDDIDPALREIVNSLTNAQQSSSSAGPNLTAAQAAAAISAHMAEHDDGARLQQSIEEITSANFGLLMPSTYPPSPPPFTLPNGDPDVGEGEGEDGEHAHAESSAAPEKKGRGRPKGSKNKPKLNPKPKPPKPPKAPAKPRGRPPRPRTAEEQAAFEAKKHDRAMGIKRKKGRPRKFPGYLVRDMRLRKNRAEYLELMRRAEEGLPLDGIEMHGTEEEMMMNHPEDSGHDVSQGIEGEADGQALQGAEEEDDEIVYPWPTDDQALLAVVGAAQQHMDVDEVDADQTEDSIRQVFGLQPIHR